MQGNLGTPALPPLADEVHEHDHQAYEDHESHEHGHIESFDLIRIAVTAMWLL